MTNIPTDFISVGTGLYIYKFVHHYFISSFLNVIHSLHPFKLVLGFKLFGDVFGFYHLLDKGGEHLMSLSVNLCAVLVEFALSQESGEEDGIVFLQVVLIHHTPFAEADDGFFGWKLEVWYHIIIDLSVCNVCHNFHPFLLSIKVSYVKRAPSLKPVVKLSALQRLENLM